MNETQHKALMLLGLARKARKLEIGEEPCGIACRSGKAKLLLIAHDAGDHTFRRARSYCRAGKPPYLCVPFTKDELGDGLGCLRAVRADGRAVCESISGRSSGTRCTARGYFAGADPADRARQQAPPGGEGTPEKREIW